MNKNLSDISNALEDEVLIARALSDIMDIFHTAACGFRKTDLDFGNIQNALWLILKVSKHHSEKLLEISNDVFNAFREQVETLTPAQTPPCKADNTALSPR